MMTYAYAKAFYAHTYVDEFRLYTRELRAPYIHTTCHLYAPPFFARVTFDDGVDY